MTNNFVRQNKQKTEKMFLKAFTDEISVRPPFWLMRQAGRYLPEYRKIRQNVSNFLEFCYNPDLAVEATLQPLKRYHMDAAILFSDILVIPDALGQKVEFSKGEGPILTPVRNEKNLDRLSLDNLHQHLAPVYEILRRLAKDIPETTSLIGFSGSPWTLATYMVEGHGSKDYALVRNLAYKQPQFFTKIINLLVDAVSAYLIEQVNNGAEALQMFDSWAGVLSENQFKQWVIEPTKEIVCRLKAVHPDVPVIGFPKGAGILYEDFVKETGVDGVSLDSTVPLVWARDQLQPHCTLQGNLDNMLLLAGGQVMEDEIKRILNILGQGPFIFNLGHGIVPETPPQNVALLTQLIRG